MEYSSNFNFYLPSRDTDDVADINQISDNFRTVDSEMKVLSEAIKYVSSAGERYGNYYYDIYKHTVLDADTLISDAGLTTPYYYYELEGWAKCTAVSEDNKTASFTPEFKTIGTDMVTGNDFLFYNNGKWVALPQVLRLGELDKNNYGFIPISDTRNTLTSLNAHITSVGSGSSAHIIEFNLSAEMAETTSEKYSFMENDIGKLCMYFRIKLDQKRMTSVG